MRARGQLEGVSRGTPAVSVVMAVHNGERFLADAIDSVLAQTLEELELILIDDGSADGSPDILAAYAAADERVVCLRQPNAGHPAALNRAIGRARSPLIARLDQDDVALPRRLELQHAALAARSDVAVIGGGVTFIDEAGKPFGEARYPTEGADIRAALQSTNPLVHSAVMMRKDAFARVGAYRPPFNPAEDLDLWLRLADLYDLANLSEVVVRYRLHDDQLSIRFLEQQALCTVAARFAARERATARPDPFAARVEALDVRALLDLGISHEQIVAEQVRSATWIAKTSGRAGYPSREEALFALAGTWAASAHGSPELVALVHRERARRLSERGRWVRSRAARARAAYLARGRRRSP